MVAKQLDAGFDQVTNNRLDIAPDIADFGKLGRLDLDKRRIGQLCQAPCNFCFTNSGRANHENVFRCDFVAHPLIELHAPPAITQSNGHGAFGVVLTNNVFVQLMDDFSGCHCRHANLLPNRARRE